MAAGRPVTPSSRAAGVSTVAMAATAEVGERPVVVESQTFGPDVAVKAEVTMECNAEYFEGGQTSF